MIGIGPVNYWLLKRQGRLPLLLVTVPTAAAATTLLLFAYGFLSEGVGHASPSAQLYVARSTGWEKLRAGHGFSYYAGVAPSEGLRMPADTLVYPILPSTSGFRATRRYANQPRELLWNDYSQQHLSRGWLASRTPTQYLAITARPTEKRLEFVSVPEGLEVTNRLGVEVLALAVQDDQGKLFSGGILLRG